MRVHFWLLTGMAVLSGCALLSVPEDSSSPFFRVPPGSVLELHEPLPIPPGRATVWLQRGGVAAGQDWWYPGCSIEVRTLDREAVQTLRPGRFVVRRVQQIEITAIPSTVGAVMVASLDSVNSGGERWFWLGYHLWLESAEQPDVLRLSCVGAYARAFEVRPPSIDEIRAALGRVATLHLP